MNSRMVLVVVGWLTLGLLSGAATAQGDGGGRARVRTIDTRYYVLHTDLDDEAVREAVLRVTAMADEYIERTRGFSGQFNKKLPLYLFSQRDDYHAAGGPAGSSGVFMGDRLMAFAGKQVGRQTWHIIQHEGFHQFAAAVIRGNLPAWVNEGMAEYFGESVFTGDGFISGVMPPARIRRVQDGIAKERFRPLGEMMALSLKEWNAGLSIHNYDQAWSMIQFLAHGEDGRYRRLLVNYLNQMSRGTPTAQAWQQNFGEGRGFEDRWKKWWQELSPAASERLYLQAAARINTAFLARAASQKQAFADFAEFSAAILDGSLTHHPDQWLPASLHRDAIGTFRRMEWRLDTGEADTATKLPPRIVAALESGELVIGTFRLRGNRVEAVQVDFDDSAVVLAEARRLIEAGKLVEARQMLGQHVKDNPRSMHVAELRAEIQKLAQRPATRE